MAHRRNRTARRVLSSPHRMKDAVKSRRMIIGTQISHICLVKRRELPRWIDLDFYPRTCVMPTFSSLRLVTMTPFHWFVKFLYIAGLKDYLVSPYRIVDLCMVLKVVHFTPSFPSLIIRAKISRTLP